MEISIVPAPALAGHPGCLALRLLGDRAVGVVETPEGTALLAQMSRGTKTLWEGPEAGAPSFARVGGTLFCAFETGPLLCIARGARGVPAATVLEMETPPARIFAAGDRLFGTPAEGSAPLVALDIADGTARWGDPLPLPELTRAQSFHGLVEDGSGLLVAMAEDPEMGFALWVQDGTGVWQGLTEKGAARFGFNTSIFEALPWGDGLALAVGAAPEIRARMSNMPVRGEVLRIHPDGDFDIICGELRVSPTGLKVPLGGARTPAAWERGSFRNLALDGTDLVAGLQRDGGEVAFYRITPGLEVTEIGESPGLLQDLVADKSGLHALVAGGPGA